MPGSSTDDHIVLIHVLPPPFDWIGLSFLLSLNESLLSLVHFLPFPTMIGYGGGGGGYGGGGGGYGGGGFGEWFFAS